MRDRLDQNTGYCWGFERMCQARTLPPGRVSTTAPLFLDPRQPGAAGATVPSLPISALLLGDEQCLWIELLPVCRITTKLLYWPVIHFQFSSWSLFLHQPSARGELLSLPSKTKLMHFSPCLCSLCCLCWGWSAWQMLTYFSGSNSEIPCCLKPFVSLLSSYPDPQVELMLPSLGTHWTL